MWLWLFRWGLMVTTYECTCRPLLPPYPITPYNPHSFGWLFPAQQILLGHVLGEGTRVVLQLGAYLGKTTRFISEQAPRVRGDEMRVRVCAGG